MKNSNHALVPRKVLRATLVTLLPYLCPFSIPTALSDELRQDDSFQIRESHSEGIYALWVMPPKVLEATVTVVTTAINMSLSRTSPFTMDVNSRSMRTGSPVCILHAKQANPSERYYFYFKYYWKFGVSGGHQDQSAHYQIPFEAGTVVHINQGYGGSFSHQRGSEEEYALDFGADQGTDIHAARGGTVIAARGDSTVGGPDFAKYASAANYVIIKHWDGTYGSYLHLYPHSLRVTVGQAVSPGQLIGKVGATGVVTEPHLHFDVSVPVDGLKRKTVPITFDAVEGQSIELQQGQAYTAL